MQIYEMSPQEQEHALGEEKIDLALLGHACPELKKRLSSRADSQSPDGHRSAR